VNYSFRENICAELGNTGGAAGELLITDEFSTDLDEMGIFVLSKDQSFRICATFLDPAKFSILVIHLILVYNYPFLHLLSHVEGILPLDFQRTPTEFRQSV
jgi:hypothetical protein